MEQPGLSQDRSSLLQYAVSRLNPEVFQHPVWMRFGRKDPSDSLITANDLQSTTQIIQGEDPGMACQILLVCAAYQNQAGQWFNAFRSTQQALTLSRSNNLNREKIWALWGASAILIQHGDYEQACIQLVDLQATLNEQNEWVLAGFIDVFRQSFSQPSMNPTGNYLHSPQDHSAEDILGFTFDWLHQWGFWSQSFETEFDTALGLSPDQSVRQTTVAQSFFSIQHWQSRMHTLMLAIRGELHFQWKENDLPSRKRKFSFGDALISYMRTYLSDRTGNTKTVEPISQTNHIILPPPVNDGSLPEIAHHKNKATSSKTKTVRDGPVRKGTTLMPMAVHMLGTFSLTIGELLIKLPASRGLSLLKYILVHRKKHITPEVLMEVFWPDSEPETARNSLDVALHSLRKALRNTLFMPVILLENGAYIIEPSLQIWLDVEEFERCVQTGQRLEAQNQITAAIAEYEAAISLYQGDFLEQNPYEEWTIADRERSRVSFLDTLERLSSIYFSQGNYGMCIMLCHRILTMDDCSEQAHRRLMRCYSSQGQQHLALRQYLVCVDAIRRELRVDPDPATVELYEQIRLGRLG